MARSFCPLFYSQPLSLLKSPFLFFALFVFPFSFPFRKTSLFLFLSLIFLLLLDLPFSSSGFRLSWQKNYTFNKKKSGAFFVRSSPCLILLELSQIYRIADDKMPMRKCLFVYGWRLLFSINVASRPCTIFICYKARSAGKAYFSRLFLVVIQCLLDNRSRYVKKEMNLKKTSKIAIKNTYVTKFIFQ